MDRHSMMEELNAFMANSRFPWAVCGGFALDLFLNKNIRTHSDIDICVFERDRDCVLQYMLDADWTVYEFRGQGKVRLLGANTPSDPGRNFMCLKDDCDIVKFYPCEEDGQLYHQFFHTGMKKFYYLEFLFNRVHGEYLVLDQEKGLRRKLSQAILVRNGIPYLAPEIALLYKASNAEKTDYQFDFEQVFPHLSDNQKAWFVHGLKTLYPNGHAWDR